MRRLAAGLMLGGLMLVALRPGLAAEPGLFEHPFATNSVWNVPLTETTRYSPVPGLAALDFGLSAWIVPDGVSFPVTRARDADPRVRVLHHPDPWPALWSGRWKTTGNSPQIEAEILRDATPQFPVAFHPYVSRSASRLILPADFDPVDGFARAEPIHVRLPAGARPSRNADGHMAVFQPDGRVFESYATILLSDGTVVALSHKLTDPALSGDGFQNGVTASMIPVYAGLIRAAELRTGRIGHALKAVAPPGLLHPSTTYPALTFDRGALTEDPPYSGPLPMGARLAIPPGIDLATLGLRTSAGYRIAEALQARGLIIVDRGGAGLTLITEPDLPAAYHWSEAAEADLARLIAVLERAEIPGSGPGPGSRPAQPLTK